MWNVERERWSARAMTSEGQSRIRRFGWRVERPIPGRSMETTCASILANWELNTRKSRDQKLFRRVQTLADVNTPFGMAEKAATLVKGCELRAFEEETHMSMPYNHFDEILKRLLEVRS